MLFTNDNSPRRYSCLQLQSLLQLPLVERRKALRESFKEVNGRFRFATYMDHKVRVRYFRATRVGFVKSSNSVILIPK